MADPNVINTWRQLLHYHRATTVAMDQHLRATFGRSLDDYDVLHQLSTHNGPMRMGELAERLLVANSSCNRIVGRLATDGLIERSHGESDGRVVLVRLTAEGQKLRRRMAVVHTRDIDVYFSSMLTTAQATELDAILQRLLTAKIDNDDN